MKSAPSKSPRQSISPRRLPVLFSLGACALLGASLATLRAQTTYTYVGPANGALDNTANYSPSGTLPNSTATTSDTIFFGTGDTGNGATALSLTSTTANFGGTNTSPLGVLFDIDGTQTATVTIGNTATIRLAGVTVGNGAGVVTFSGTGGYNIGGTTGATTNTFTNNDTVGTGSTLVFSSNLLAGGGGPIRTLDFEGAGNTTVSGALNAAAFIVQKGGAGTLTLSGANIYTGATSLNAGITVIRNATALGTTAAGTTVASGATLQLQNNITVGAEALTISGTGATGGAGALENNGGANTYGGAITLGASSTVAVDSGTTLNLTSGTAISGSGNTLSLVGSGTGSISSGIATGSGGLIKNGTGTWTLSAASTYTGATSVYNGNLALTNGANSATGSGVVNVGNAGTGTPLNATISGTGASAGLLTVAAGARIAPGVNTVNADGSGRLNFGNVGALTLGSTGGLTLTNANLDYDLSSSAASGNDSIATGATLTLGTLVLNVNELNGTLATGTAYTLVSGATAETGFNAANITTNFINGTTYNATYSLSGDNLQVTFTPVPEPSTFVGGLFGAGLAVCAWRRRGAGISRAI